jgi:hypothetical protein
LVPEEGVLARQAQNARLLVYLNNAILLLTVCVTVSYNGVHMRFQEIVIPPKVAGVYLLQYVRTASANKKLKTIYEYYVGESVDVWGRLHEHSRYRGYHRSLILTTDGCEDGLYRLRLEKRFIVAAKRLPLVLRNGADDIYKASVTWANELLENEMDLLESAVAQLQLQKEVLA